jgi:hypothetical protein
MKIKLNKCATCESCNYPFYSNFPIGNVEKPERVYRSTYCCGEILDSITICDNCIIHPTKVSTHKCINYKKTNIDCITKYINSSATRMNTDQYDGKYCKRCILNILPTLNCETCKDSNIYCNKCKLNISPIH